MERRVLQAKAYSMRSGIIAQSPGSSVPVAGKPGSLKTGPQL